MTWGERYKVEELIWKMTRVSSSWEAGGTHLGGKEAEVGFHQKVEQNVIQHLASSDSQSTEMDTESLELWPV